MAEERFVVKRMSLPGSKIDELVWSDNELDVENRKSKNKVEFYVTLRGTYAKQKFDLYALNRLVTRAPVSGSFAIKIRFLNKPVEVSFRAVGPSGDLKTEKVLLIKVPRQLPPP